MRCGGLTRAATFSDGVSHFNFLANGDLDRMRRQMTKDNKLGAAAMNDDVVASGVSGGAFALYSIGVFVDDGDDGAISR